MSLSALYFGHVFHHRMHPRVHRFRYGVMSLLLDLDQVDELHHQLRLFSHNRFNLYAFYDRDHGNGTPGKLKPQILRQLEQHDIDIDDGKILLLCYPRILGFVFNPLSVYYCYDSNANLRAILYEVSNTFGQRHSYLLPTSSTLPVQHSVDKCFYVSPFMPMRCRYHFQMQPPGPRIGVQIEQSHHQQPIFRASFSGVRRPLCDRTLLQACLRYPLMTLKVIAGIHWEAVRLWCKGMRIQPRPAPPAAPITLACTAQARSTESHGDRRHETH
ncbi:DUF1365 domain-containing protein [Marinobacterium rhizophilum]|uniref:DUF1365 domain-containing protein n=1 Tax=Marinobacterium rhizophilum TaxID=420402 RepID=A0ABY5HKW5_9GAMM|nr:DUF1365 domain-containing protein [Marinobacterium rhizophilum]UTW12442.1 DUF1365 domain-containing protein [Marinobacterium rhizophilum]